jgi:hypothetical protein
MLATVNHLLSSVQASTFNFTTSVMARTKQTARGGSSTIIHVCGCYVIKSAPFGGTTRVYLPQTHLDAQTKVFSTAFSTVLTQTFEAKDGADEIR